ncbi:MAG: nucleoside recognition domain-containing protein [Chthoniobacter sp.]|uniref:nucleoside recognition domain-containing protein n=1 Tax=Chthoniobacter sp. TaxID=2510640 RepID=UPI0032AB4BF6
MLNWIWLAFLLIAVLVGGFNGKLPQMTTGVFETASDAVMKIALPLVGVMAIWLGIMRLAERSGLVQFIARALRPLLRLLFPEVPPDHPAMGAIVMNMAANMLGLGNAATPLGLRAMSLLEKLNPRPGTATNAMCTFLAINTASIQLVPTTAIAILAVNHAQNPTAIFLPALLATCIAACSGVCAAKVLERLPMFRAKDEGGAEALRDVHGAMGATMKDEETAAATTTVPVEEVAVEKVEVSPLHPIGAIALVAFVLCFVWMFARLTWLAPSADLAEKPDWLRPLLVISMLAVPFLLSFFPLYAALRGVKVYEQFVEGAKEAFGVGMRIVPFLVAMLVAIRLLRDSGVIAQVTDTLTPVLAALRFPADLLPMVLMRPLSGSATQGLFVELVQHLGPDNIVSRMAATIYGSTETTFYVIAVYFGSVAVRQTRHAILAGLTADTVAVIASITLCRLFF